MSDGSSPPEGGNAPDPQAPPGRPRRLRLVAVLAAVGAAGAAAAAVLLLMPAPQEGPASTRGAPQTTEAEWRTCDEKHRMELERLPDPLPEGHPLELYDDNGDMWIRCAEARGHGIAPVMRSHPAYPFMCDPNNDGQVC